MTQTKVDSDVQEVIANTNAVYQALLDLWAMTPIELKMYIMMMFVVSILLQYYKKSFLTGCTKKERIQKLWMVSFPLGIVLAAAAYPIYENKIHLGYFILTGLTVSTVSMGVHRMVVDYVYPAIKIIAEAIWSRLTLIIRGKPKDAG